MGWYVAVVINTVLSAGWVLAIGLVGSIILTPAFGFFTFWNAVRTHFAKASSALATPTRDSLVVYKHRADIRETEQRAYAEQVNLALANPNVPVIPVGEATGMAFARGSSRSLLKGSVMSVDGYSIRQHVLAFGGTGEGKTELFLKPMTRRVLSANWQEGMTMGAYITDGKGVLYKDIITIPEIQSRASEIKVLGTEPGHYGVNIVEGMTPISCCRFRPKQRQTRHPHGSRVGNYPDFTELGPHPRNWPSRSFFISNLGNCQTPYPSPDGLVCGSCYKHRSFCRMGSCYWAGGFNHPDPCVRVFHLLECRQNPFCESIFCTRNANP